MKTLMILAALYGGTGQPNPYYGQNAYGPGASMDQYGGMHKTDPMSQRVEPNAYGPGVHMDEYGRAIDTNQWYLNDD